MSESEGFRRVWTMMGSYLELIFHGPDAGTLEQAALAVYEDADRLEKLLSRFDGESETSLINALAAESPVPVEPITFDLLVRARRYWRDTGGAFDITAGSLVDLWLGRPEGAEPPEEEIAERRARVGFEHVRLDLGERRVALDDPGVLLDPGGIGKGLAADRAAEIARGRGVWSGLISLGGSSIFALGGPPGRDRWRIEVEHPLLRGRAIASIEIADEALAASGTRRRSLAALGREPPAHIVDPRTGRLARGPIAAVVVAPRAEIADVLSTSIMILDRDESLDLLRRHGAREGIRFFAEAGRVRRESLGPDGWLAANEVEA